MGDSGHLDDNDPAQFLSWLIGRLSEIPGITWRENPRAVHTSYEDWHVWGTRDVLVDEQHHNGSPGMKRSSPITSTRNSISGSIDQISTEPTKTQKVIARISKHSLRLERQYQLSREVLDAIDPGSDRHLKALALMKLAPRNADETQLTVVLFEDIQTDSVNDLRHIINYGPNWFFYDESPRTHPWDATRTSSKLHPVGHVAVTEFLDIAIGACKCLEMIHQGSKYVHGELRGDSFFYDRSRGTMKIQNFGAGIRSYENGFTNTGWTSLSKEYGIEHKLQFVAPEQTGRSQAQPDARTDVYSLGVLFYNMLTGLLPFAGSTALEVMQSVLSRRPPPIANVRPDVPDALAAIITRMLQKNIEHRYHSASGVKHDLKLLQRLLVEGDQESLGTFQPGTKDISPYFILPSALVGREAEREKMKGALDRLTAQQTLQKTALPQHRYSSSLSSESSLAERRSVIPVVSDEVISEAGSFTQPSVDSVAQLVGGGLTSEPDAIEAREEASSKHTPLTKKLSGHDSALHEAPMSRSLSAMSDTLGIPLRNNRRYRSDSKTEVIVLGGAPGLGKSSLMQDFQPAVRSLGYFCTSKFDLSKKIAFEPVLAVLSTLFRQIFSERDLNSPFHQSLRAFIRPVWKVLHTMLNLPEWLLIDGAQEHHVDRPGSLRRRSSNIPVSITTSKPITVDIPRQANSGGSRFMAIYLDVLSFLAAQKLIVFCLDDFHLADTDSLDLLQAIEDAKIPMLILLTSNNTTLSGKAQALLDTTKANITEIELKPLSEDQVGQYVVATLHRSQEYLFSLIAVIWSKTGGNPFYVREMLSSCYRKECVAYNWKQSEWTYDLDRIFEEFEGPGYDSRIDNDNDFIITRLTDLPQQSRKLLSWAAIIGCTFSFSLVKAIMTGHGAPIRKENEQPLVHQYDRHKIDLVRQASQDAVRGLQAALSAYIIRQADDDDHFAFVHDRYQQSALALPEGKDQKEMHFQVAQAMIHRGIDDRDLYDLSSHICASVDLIKQKCPVRAQYREVLITAASKLIAIQGGRSSALNYLTNALALLQRNPWVDDGHDVDYEETMSLFVQTAETYWLQGFVEPALALLSTSSKQAKTASDRVSSQILHSRIMARRGDSNTSLRILLQSLSELGMTISEITFEECDRRLEALMPVLRDGSAIQKLLDPSSPARETKDDKFRILGEAMANTFWTDSKLYYQLALVELELHLQHGNTAYSGLAYIHIAAIVVTRFDDVKLALQLGNAGQVFFDKASINPWVYGRVHLLYSLFLGHLERHVVHDVEALDIAVEKSLASGDRFFALVNIGYGVAIKISTSQDFAELEHYCNWGAEEIKEWQDDVRGSVLVIGARQWLRSVCGKTRVESAEIVMTDAGHESGAYLEHITRKSSDPTRSASIYNGYMMSSLFLFGHVKEAIDLGDEVIGTFQLYWSSRFVVWMAFYYTLATLHLLREEPNHPRKLEWLQEARRRRDRMIKWSIVSDVNYGCWTKLVTAQLEEFDGHYGTCLKTYEAAIDHAELNSFTFEQALAYELYAEFMIRRGANRPARSALKEAIGTYRHISCFGKASHLAAKHEFLLAGTSSLNRMNAGTQTLDVANSVSPPLTRSQPWQKPITHAHSHSSSADVLLSPKSVPDHAITDRFPPVVDALDMIDIAGILRSSQVLASELDVDRLLAKLTKIILESTGAELTAIIVENRDKSTWNVAAISDTASNDYPSNESLEDVETTVCTNIALSCLRFKETILAENVFEDERFPNVHEGYRSRYHPGGRAVCAMPIFHGQRTVLGCIYIEGSPHTFGERCVNFLRLLSSSVSISINNAMLFKRVEKVSASNALMVESQKHALAKAQEAEKKAKLAEAEALRNVRLKEEAARAKSLFLANVSHELRTRK